MVGYVNYGVQALLLMTNLCYCDHLGLLTEEACKTGGDGLLLRGLEKPSHPCSRGQIPSHTS